jgi:hypothetical protein
MMEVTVIVITQTKGETDSQLLKCLHFTAAEDADIMKMLGDCIVTRSCYQPTICP